MAALSVSPLQRLIEVEQACYTSPIVSYVEEVLVDSDILKVRVYLVQDEMFIDVFYNVATDKTSFALIKAGQRVYGADNAKMGWHKHPFDAAQRHRACPPVAFAEFLADVERYFPT
ncbi:MAG: hypothetical protein JXR84_22050 [Anaerolineae bacterium]|nr:hypothetical protein [Anaerolineae bacterium]